MVPSPWLIGTAPRLLLWGFVKTAMLPLLFLSIFRPESCLGDLGALMLIGSFWSVDVSFLPIFSFYLLSLRAGLGILERVITEPHAFERSSFCQMRA